jgi:hypothetical protein
MGSFAGVNINAQNLEQSVSLAEQKKILSEQSKLQSFSFNNYKNDVVDNSFPDGQYYVVTDFVSTEIRFQGGLPPREGVVEPLPVKKIFKKGDLVDVETVIVSTALQKAKAIKTPMGNFSFNVNDLSKTKPIQNIVPEVSLEAKEKNQNKLIIMVIGAFVLGYLLSND